MTFGVSPGNVVVTCFVRSLTQDCEQSAVDTIKYDLGIAQRGYYGVQQVKVTITGAPFYNEDGTHTRLY